MINVKKLAYNKIVLDLNKYMTYNVTKRIIFDMLLNIFRNKQRVNQNEYKYNLSLKESYELLGIDENASLEVIIKSHKELIRKLHPDKGGNSYLSAKVNEARDIILADRERREKNG